MTRYVVNAIALLGLFGATGAQAQISPSTDEFRREMACERFIELLEYEVEWFAGVEADAETFDPANRPAMCAFLQASPAPDREALCMGPPPEGYFPEFLTPDQVSFLVQIAVAKSNLDAFANGFATGQSVDLHYVRTQCSLRVEQQALRLMRAINELQLSDCLDPCGNAITLPGISHSGAACPEL